MADGLVEDPASLRDGASAIHRNAQNEMRLISDLLNTSQFLVGRLHSEKNDMDLVDVVRQAVNAMRAQASKRNIKIEITDILDSARVRGDADRLLQVINNLLMNALKFTPSDGQIQVELVDEGAFIRFAIQDDVEGIEPELLPKIFDRFQSQSGKINRQHGGLGLGLAIVKSLVEAHSGKIVARSEGLGRGARFEVRLPQLARTSNAQTPRTS